MEIIPYEQGIAYEKSNPIYLMELCKIPLSNLSKYGTLVDYGWITHNLDNVYEVYECPALILEKGVLPHSIEKEIIQLNTNIGKITKLINGINVFKQSWEYGLATKFYEVTAKFTSHIYL